jgi:hypothetical protein
MYVLIWKSAHSSRPGEISNVLVDESFIIHYPSGRWTPVLVTYSVPPSVACHMSYSLMMHTTDELGATHYTYNLQINDKGKVVSSTPWRREVRVEV